jgi:hypothetical protein
VEPKLADAIRTAYEAVREAKLPPELEGFALYGALRLLGDRSHLSHGDRPHANSAGPTVAASGLDRLAARVGVSASALGDLFEVQGDDVAREVALLIAAARQGSGADDAWTSVGHIRDALQDYKKYDPNNFAAYLRRVADAFNFRGKGTSMEVRLTQPGWETAIALIASLAGRAA